MALLKEIQDRHAFRGISEKTIPVEVLERLVKSAHLAPSCANKQPWKFILLQGKEELESFRECLDEGNYWARKSPAVILVTTSVKRDLSLSHGRQYALFDTGLATMNLILQAQHEGVIAHPIAGFKPEKAGERFRIPEGEILITCIILGYPGPKDDLSEKHQELEQGFRQRKPLEEIAFRGDAETPWENL